MATAEDEHAAVVKSAQEQAGEHADEVNWETGQVLTGWDSMYNGVISAVNWIRDLFGMSPLEKRGQLRKMADKNKKDKTQN
ncbi:hypothetical protein AAHH67_09710 [Niallia circulans]